MAIEKMLAEGTISGKAKASLGILMDNFAEWRKSMQAITPDELASLILEDSGYIESLKNDKSPEAPAELKT